MFELFSGCLYFVFSILFFCNSGLTTCPGFMIFSGVLILCLSAFNVILGIFKIMNNEKDI